MTTQLISETEDFRMYAAEHEKLHGGNVRVFRACESLEDGRWEGFISLVGEYTAAEWKKNGKAIMERANARQA